MFSVARMLDLVPQKILSVLICVTTFSGCSAFSRTFETTADGYGVGEQTATLRAPQTIALVNGYPAETKVTISRSWGVSFDADMRQLTDTAIEMTSRHLQQNGISRAPQASKMVTLGVRDAKTWVDHGMHYDHTFPYFYTQTSLPRAYVRLQAKLGDGTEFTVRGEGALPDGEGMLRALQVAIVRAVAALLNYPQFVAYING